MRMLSSCVFAVAGLLTTACSLGSAETVQRGPAAPVEQATSNSEEHHINTLTEQIVGDWRSVYDGKEVVTFGADGSWMSSYDGNASETGTWVVFAGNAPPLGLSHSFEPAKNYLQVLREEWPPLVSEIGDVGPNDLELFYLGNGRRNAYTRAN